MIDMDKESAAKDNVTKDSVDKDSIAKGYYAYIQDNVYEKIKPHIKDRSVLDCGCVGNSPGWHKFMKSNASEYVGVDIQNEIGIPDVVIGNVETIKLDRKFDVVLAGDMLALLDNQGFFLDNMKAHLNPGGLIIVTHSNCSGLYYRLRGSPFDSYDKSCKHNEKTISCLLGAELTLLC
jgi:2-polyprenyl-3-methyl-5-hydroxy-6-metoxy-1,4-benzoquinol methylase